MIRALSSASLLLSLASSASAADREAQYRKLTLADGREMVAEIVGTESTGLELRIPQGRSMLSFELLSDMVPVTSDEYAMQTPWTVVVYGNDSLVQTWAASYDAIENVQSVTDKTGLSSAESKALAECGRDLVCAATKVPKSPWRWLVHIDSAEDGSIEVRSRVNTGRTTTRTMAADTSADEVWSAAHASIDLLVDSPSPFRVPDSETQNSSRKAKSTGLTKQQVVGLSFAPVPGITSFKQGDKRRGLGALAVVLPATAAWAAVTGLTSQSTGEHVATSVAGFYVFTVSANQAFGMGSFNRKTSISLAPTRHGGAAITFRSKL